MKTFRAVLELLFAAAFMAGLISLVLWLKGRSRG